MAKGASTPQPPAPPSATGSLNEYISNIPRMYEAEQEYGTKFGELQKQQMEQLYPQTAGLQELLAGQITQGLTEDVPQWYSSQVEDILKSQLGRNLVYNPQAQESFGLKTQEAHKGYQDYYRNLAMSAAGRQPLAQSQALTSGFTPQSVMGMNQGNFGTQMQGWSTQAGLQQQQNQFNQMQPFRYLQGAGNLMSSVGSMGGFGSGGGFGGGAGFGGF